MELFDLLNQSSAAVVIRGAGSTALLEIKQEEGLEKMIKQLKKVNQVLKESAIAN